MPSKILIFLSLISIISTFEPIHEKEIHIFAKFKEFMIKYNKSYTTIEEFNQRFLIFRDNYLKVQEFSKTGTYSKGITKFSDLTKDEFTRKHTGFKQKEEVKREHNHNLELIDKVLPESLNWKEKGAVTEVKDQGQCGGCWAFASVGNLEGLYFIQKKGPLTRFSEQLIISCDDYDHGCDDGWMESAFTWLSENDGNIDEESYPYFSGKAGHPGVCDIPTEIKATVRVSGFKFIGTSVNELKQALNSIGPMAVAVNADPLQYYTGGIINDDARTCNPHQLSHGVILIGWGSENGKDYWIVKNSWDVNWGEEGYFRILIIDDGEGICGINRHVVTAILY